jgi:hypothetical protein
MTILNSTIIYIINNLIIKIHNKMDDSYDDGDRYTMEDVSEWVPDSLRGL